MCGIAGMIGVPPEIAQAIAPRLLAAIGHRGPDGRGTIAVESRLGRYPAVLLHTRLAIIELSAAGAQPMQDHPPDPAAPPNWVTFNGEVFNYQDIHADLAAKGWPCRSRSDTEVILNGYRVWGPDCVQRFRGFFAWALADPAAGTVWLCRDRHGIKPLYIARPTCGGLIFASEVRALLAAGPDIIPPKLSPAAVESFLAQGAVFGRESIVEGIEMLAPGTSLIVDWDGRERKSASYWSLPDAVKEPATDRAAAVDSLGATLREAVRLRLISDVPLGLFLSGGIDSASLAVAASEVAGSQLNTLTIGFDEAAYDESAVAAGVAETLGTKHTTIRLRGADVVDQFPAFLAAVDQPTVDGMNTFIVSQAARRAGLTVALSGLGGDELFGGYASFRDVPRSAKWQKLGRAVGPLVRPIRAGLSLHRFGRRGVKAAELLRRPDSAIHRYLLRRELFFPHERRAAMPRPDQCDPFSGLTHESMAELAAESHDPDPVNEVSRLELRGYMTQMLLRDSDAFSMAAPIELRVPFLDHLLVEEALRLPGAWKRPNPNPKPLLIDAVGPRLPALLATLPKKGFTFPWGPWFRGPLAPTASRAIQNADLWQSVGINPAAPVSLWNAFLAGDRSIAPLQPLAYLVLADYIVRHGLTR